MSLPRTLVRRSDVEPKLSKAEQKLFAEALSEGEAAGEAMQSALVDFGRWLLVHVFDDDASAALDDRSENAVWLALLHRAGGPSLKLSRKLLYVAVEIAARDKRINDEVWRELDAGRKELLLPLGDEKLMRKAARHVVDMKLSHEKTTEYVASLRKEQGNAPRARITAARLISRVRGLREAFTTPAARRRIERLVGELDAEEHVALRAELRELEAWASDLTKALGKRG